METVFPVNNVPYYAQFEDVEHISAYISGERHLEDDPFWAKSGAATPNEYAYWANRACGMVCVKTCVEAFGGPIRSLHHWIKQGVAANAYLTDKRKNNITVEKGWLHSGLAQVMESEGLVTMVKACTAAEIVTELKNGRLLIASVSYEIGTAQPISQQGGHLVIVTGAVLKNGCLHEIRLHNPSGRTPQLRENALIPIDRFTRAFSGRVITAIKFLHDGKSKEQ